MKVVATAYACEPNRGSEPGIGWNIVREVARQHDVWVITRVNHREVIEAALEADPEPGLHVEYFDLPAWARWWKRGARGLQAYYYLWQIGAYRRAQALHRSIEFDLAHHVTFGRYWNPSFLPGLGLPFVWGPVGGGESAPEAFRATFGRRGQLYERTRDAMRGMGERDPFVRRTARQSTIAFATTTETERRLRHLGASQVEVLGNAALNQQELTRLAALPGLPERGLRFVSAGRLLHWKGVHLGLRAFAEAEVAGAEYWIIGDGPERESLTVLCNQLGIEHHVQFWGHLSREETLRRMGECHALVHPSLHDSGGWVCIEAMAAGRPVLCLDLGGPGVLVTDETGIAVAADDPTQAVQDLAAAMRGLGASPELRQDLGHRAQQRAQASFTWEAKGRRISEAYITALGQNVSTP